MSHHKKQPKIGLGPLNQSRPFQVVLDEEFKQALQERSNETGRTYWVFFTTSGQARVEPAGNRTPLHELVLEVKPQKV